MQPHLQSVNVAVPRPERGDGSRSGQTGIDKRPVDGAVVVRVASEIPRGGVGLAGDWVSDVSHHGGPDQALYAYAREDLDRFAAELGRPLSDGSFGENLTTRGVEVTGALIGERWRIGKDVVVEVSRPRIPCRTFQDWLHQPGWITTFTAAALPGAYLRVITAGEIAAGDRVEVAHRPRHDVTIGSCFRAMTLEPDLLPLLLEIDALPDGVRDLARRRIGRGSTDR